MTAITTTNMHQFGDHAGWRFGIPTTLSWRVKLTGAGRPSLTAEDRQSNYEAEIEARELKEARIGLLNLLDDHVFMLECVRYLASKLDDGRSGHAENAPFPAHYHGHDDTVDARQEHRIILRRRRDAEILQPLIRVIFNSMAAQILRSPIPAAQGALLDDGKLMLRAVLPHSATRHDAQLGFICGNAHLAVPDFHSETLESSPYMNSTKLISHCEGQQNLSDFVSMFDSPHRLRKFITSWSAESIKKGYIAVINPSKLQMMRVLFERTTSLARQLGIPRPEYATDNFWIAYRWIPAQCIECYLTLAGFHEICG